MCLKKKKTPEPRPGLFVCKKCGSASKHKDKLCKPKKVKE